MRPLSSEKREALEFLSHHERGMWVILGTVASRRMFEQLERRGFIEPWMPDPSASVNARPVQITARGREALEVPVEQ